MTLSSYHRWVGVLHILWDSGNGRSRLYKSILLLSLLLHLSVNMNLTSVDGAEIEKEVSRLAQRDAG